jgi:ribosomal protein S18 acetylase RimI-like enzyme
MELSIRRADVKVDAALLARLDRKIFSKADAYNAADFKRGDCGTDIWLVEIDSEVAGTIAFSHNIEPDETPAPGTLCITNTALLPRYQGRGIGKVLKAWQLAYAGGAGFTRLVTCARKSNVASIKLNEQFGFKLYKRITRYYSSPREAAVVLERML